MQRFSSDVYMGKIYINVPRTQYNIFNKTISTQTLHVKAYEATVCLQSY